MKASRVKGLRPGTRLGGAAHRIARQRVSDLLAFDEAVRDPGNVRELHDLRIAAKRLRYTLEVLGSVLGPAATVVEDEARALQDLLGEVHDCDVLVPRLQRELALLTAQDALAVAALAESDPARRRASCARPRAGPSGTASSRSPSASAARARCCTSSSWCAGTRCSRVAR